MVHITLFLFKMRSRNITSCVPDISESGRKRIRINFYRNRVSNVLQHQQLNNRINSSKTILENNSFESHERKKEIKS